MKKSTHILQDKLVNLVIKIILVCITVLEVMFIHNECLTEAKDICSRACVNLKTYPTMLCNLL